MPKGNEYAYGAGPGGGMGEKHGEIASPLGPTGYSIEAGGGQGQKGGEPDGPFGQYKQSQSILPITTRDGLQGAPQQGFGNVGSGGGIATPMDNSGSAMPGVTGSSGSGSISGGGAKISTSFTSPWGDKVGG